MRVADSLINNPQKSASTYHQVSLMQPPAIPPTIPATEAPTDLSRARLAIVVGNQIMSVPADGIGASFGFQPADPALTSFSGVSWVAGDMVYFSGVDTATRLAKGTASQQLRMNAGATAPEWFTPAGLDAALTSIAGVSWVAGDLGYWSGTDVAARLAKGTAGQVLRMNAGATAPEWGTLSVDYGAGNAALAYGDIGTYVLGFRRGTGLVANATLAGSAIEPAGIDDGGVAIADDAVVAGRMTKGGAALSGTWRIMGQSNNTSAATQNRITLFLRIS
jgi:hypothetical protein